MACVPGRGSDTPRSSSSLANSSAPQQSGSRAGRKSLPLPRPVQSASTPVQICRWCRYIVGRCPSRLKADSADPPLELRQCCRLFPRLAHGSLSGVNSPRRGFRSLLLTACNFTPGSPRLPLSVPSILADVHSLAPRPFLRLPSGPPTYRNRPAVAGGQPTATRFVGL